MAKISRRSFLSTGAASAVVCAGAKLGVGRGSSQSDSGGPKNVLFLMSDQHAKGILGVEGDSLARTPQLDALARDGVRFSNAYCTNPVCVPSRASILTGLYTHNHRTWNNATPWPFENKTVAHHFRRAGYITGLIGKMHFVDGQTHGFDYHLDFNDWFQYLGPKTKIWADELGQANSGSGLPQIDDLWRDSGDPWIGARAKDSRRGFVVVGGPSRLAERDHFESFVARESIRFLKRHAPERPFFLISSFLKPHDPFTPPPRFAQMYPTDQMPLPRTWNKVDLNNVPREIRNRIGLDRPTPELQDPSAARLRRAMYYANLAFMDECLGQVLRTLDEVGVAENTIVVYSSDHGEMLGEHNLWAKFVFYEPSVGVPLIFRVPGLARQNGVCHTPVSLVQLLATLCELCNIDIPSGLDGESLVSVLRQPSARTETAVYSEYNLQTPNAKYMIRRGDWKYCYYVSDTPELYNLRDDSEELKNLATSVEYRGKAEELKAQLFAWHRPEELRNVKS
jgi:choline-sulfatase